MASSVQPAEQASSTSRQRQAACQPVTPAACEACRKQKMRCIRSFDISPSSASSQQKPPPCDRCRRNGRSCYIPERRTRGRRPGSTGRYSGVEKAVRQLTAQVRKASRVSSRQQQEEGGWDDAGIVSDALRSSSSADRQVLEILMSFGTSASAMPSPFSMRRTLELSQHPAVETIAGSPPENSYLAAPSDGSSTQHRSFNGVQQDTSPHRVDESISNPLGLLADASGEAQAGEAESEEASQADPILSMPMLNEGQTDHLIGTATLDRRDSIDPKMASSSSLSPPDAADSFYQPARESTARAMLSRPGYVSLGLKMDRGILESALDNLLRSPPGRAGRYANYFSSKEHKAAPDTGPDVDPIDLGLISMAEVEYLFPIFFERLHPINGILDPGLHTPEFVRPRSALLFTWILAITAQFDHGSGPRAKRLRLHGEKLSKHVYSSGYKSVEIAQGYYISLLAAVPANTAAEDHSWIYTNYTLGMVSDLGLEKTANGISNASSPGNRQNSSHDARTNGTTQEAPTSQQMHEVRLRRNRERTWFRILLWERAQSAAHGKVTPFPDNDLIRRAADWWCHPLADPTDRYTSAFVLLRQRLASLHYQIKDRFARSDNPGHWVRDLVDSDLHSWRRTWLVEETPAVSMADTMRQLFLRYVYMHGRLWTLSFALHDPSNSARDDSADATKDDCFEAAINCCEVTIRDLREIGEPMYCLMAPTWAMSSYAAVLALKLFPQLYGDRPGQQVELLAMLAEVAAQLERAGTTPSPRFGVAALLGQHLFIVLKRQLRALRRESATAGLEMFPAPAPVSRDLIPVSGYEPSRMMDEPAVVGSEMPDTELQGQSSQAPAYYCDSLMLDDMALGDPSSLQDTFASMMRDWGGPPFDFEGVYY